MTSTMVDLAMRRRTFRTIWLLLVRWWRRDRPLWRCPRCLKLRWYGLEHIADTYPMLDDMWKMPACCRQEFPKWAYGDTP